MTRESKLEHIYAMKAELEQLGCQVVITDHYPDEDLLEVTIVYPPEEPASSSSEPPVTARYDDPEDPDWIPF